jgi:hypothetical protein
MWGRSINTEVKQPIKMHTTMYGLNFAPCFYNLLARVYVRPFVLGAQPLDGNLLSHCWHTNKLLLPEKPWCLVSPLECTTTWDQIRRWLGNFLTWYAIQLFTQCQQHRAHLFPFIFHASQSFSYDIPQLEDYNFWHSSCVLTWKILQSLLRLANPFNFPI